MALSQIDDLLYIPLKFNNSCVYFDLLYVYDPESKYDIFALISTKSRNRVKKNLSPPRPPNIFFLFKNCFMLEIKSQFPNLFEKLSMPNLCKYAREIWKKMPEDVKSIYRKFSAQSIHNELYPNYKYTPRKKKGSASQKEEDLMANNLVTFSSTNILGRNRKSNTTPIISSSETSSSILSAETSPTISSPETSPIISSFEGFEYSNNPNNFNFNTLVSYNNIIYNDYYNNLLVDNNNLMQNWLNYLNVNEYGVDKDQEYFHTC
ncbi:26449_t:CDS:2 [Dentiscutata erythropus]|uniref:26449_t:CDS:1 n=1 Tax=Dentiscutata erythropus TaxID=1348616 RepID=A0A9N9NHQ6_9GLOM|nr:26449_t:CDS:2 [Dentiscutata erythropus]